MSSVNSIRAHFLDFFRQHNHEIVSSASLVPHNDPSLMFTNAGMVPFKNVFTGLEHRARSRAATSQKCVRAGGKHNDLDNVGYTARHHTFFEMLGNFSFGDYFKAEAIELAWALITREWGLNRDRLLITVFHEDEEAAGLWRKIAGVAEDRILRIATQDNFWAMGDSGPCGPCSEIFYDHGPAIAGGPPGSSTADGDRYVEIWNLVFMQYETLADGTRVNLPRPSIDTGMGLERIAAVLQGQHDNYDIDLMRALIVASAEASGTESDGAHKVSHRVIADHLRASAFLIADGVLPSNEGRGYVLRRIMRRAMRHAQLLGAEEPLMERLTPALIREMGAAYPELVRAEALIAQTLRLEETRFRTTLARGLMMLEGELQNMPADALLSGEAAFKLYDTYGFPLDLTQDALRSRHRSVDVPGFEAAMARQKAEARKAWAGSGETATEALWFGLRDRWGATDFVGYETDQAEGQVVALVRGGEEVERLDEGETGFVLLPQTPFYAESGGQVADIGTFTSPEVRARVLQVQKKLGDMFVHEVEVEAGCLTVGTKLTLQVDAVRRLAVRANHSATHLLHEALRNVLGDHVAQKGSLVTPQRLRFDFSHPQPLTEAELAQVEDRANAMILHNAAVSTQIMGLEAARASGARALFGEKYGDEVRVVSMDTSVELCGGLHVARTGEIGLIALLGESAVASGVRRIEAQTRDIARHRLRDEARHLHHAASLLKSPATEVADRLGTLLQERRKLESALSDMRRKQALESTQDTIRDVGGVKFYARIVQGVDMKDLKPMADEAKSQIGSGIVAIAATNAERKASLVVAVTQDLTARFDAVALVKRGAEALGGKGGGGRADMAQAGGPDGARLSEALAAVESALAEG